MFRSCSAGIHQNADIGTKVMKGWVYIATMSDAEGVVKIGYSTKDPNIRIKEWAETTGAPGKAHLAYAALVENPRKVERATHRDLKAFNTKGEWFRVPEMQALAAIRNNATPLFEDGILVTGTTDVEEDKGASAFKLHRKKEQKKRRVRRESKKVKEVLLGLVLVIPFVVIAFLLWQSVIQVISPGQ